VPDSPIKKIERDLAAGRIVVLDGGIGTELQKRGATMHPDVWCGTATLDHPDILRGVHEDYIRAGSQIITTNTFSTSRNMLGLAGLGNQFAEINRRAVEIALEARDRQGVNETVAVAGSMSHQVPVAAGTDRRDWDRLPPIEVIEANHREMAAALADFGVDFILMEMMSDPDLANPAIEAAQSTGLPVWIGYSCRADHRGEPVSYALENLGLEEMLARIPPGGAGAIGMMHTNVDLISPSIKAMRTGFDGPIMAYPDTGHFEMPNWHWVDTISAADFADAALGWIDEGVQIVGGCCGLGVEHIDTLVSTLERRS